MNCKSCNAEVAQTPGRRAREFCNATCRQRYHRAKHNSGTVQADKTELFMTDMAPAHELQEAQQRIAVLIADLAETQVNKERAESHAMELGKMLTSWQREALELKAKLTATERERDKLATEISRLRSRLEVEKRLLDGKPRVFKFWLRTRPKTP